jgi:hypothetical protein
MCSVSAVVTRSFGGRAIGGARIDELLILLTSPGSEDQGGQVAVSAESGSLRS